MSWTAALVLCASADAAIWEAGELDYPSGESEVAAFVDGPSDTQLQLVLCSRGEPLNWRLSLLLPDTVMNGMVLQVGITAGERTLQAYAEVTGNSLEMQVDENVVVSLADVPSLRLQFSAADAALLHLPETLELSTQGADFSLRKVGAECVARCTRGDYSCNRSLLSSLVWPRNDFQDGGPLNEIERLCTRPTNTGRRFDDNSACRLALDRFYLREGQGPLSFLHMLFTADDSPYRRYTKLWNEVVAAAPSGPLSDEITATDRDWYLLLYALQTTGTIREFPQSFLDILNANGDPTTLLYDIDNRYEMEQLKYTAVLTRRLKATAYGLKKSSEALNSWAEFYRELVAILPLFPRAQATRPLLYRQMLMRLWRLAGMPEGLNLHPERMFRQGVGGRPSTGDPLEARCSTFEGMRGDQFFYGSTDCRNGVANALRHRGFTGDDWYRLEESWHVYEQAWAASIFGQDADLDLGEPGRSRAATALPGFALTTLTLDRIFGFGDYFLLRECISSGDSDICNLEADRAYDSYHQELRQILDSIGGASAADANALSKVCALWERFYEELNRYTGTLVNQGRITRARAYLVLGTAAVMQTAQILNVPYYRDSDSDEQ